MNDIGQHHKDCHESELDGAEVIRGRSAMMRDRVMTLFAQYGPMTDEEAIGRYAQRYEPIPINVFVPRRYELVQAGRLYKTEGRREGRSGIRRIVWAEPKERGMAV